jgi:UDP-2,3-diacylglucosamine pyrophosphatase LpxH
MRTIAALSLLLACGASIADTDRYVAFISDLHVGAGRQPNGDWKQTEDFRWQNDFNRFLDFISEGSKNKTDLVLVGDVFELWQSPTMTCSADLASPGCVVPDCNESDTEIGCSEPEARARLDYTLRQHRDFVDALRQFAARGANRVYFIPGNHDAALLFPDVRKLLLDNFKNLSVQVQDQGYWLSLDGQIYSDHGHQFDDVNTFTKWPRPFVQRNGVTYLRKPWGENMVQQFYNEYEEIFPIIDNLSDEKAGVAFAVEQVGFQRSELAVGKFLRFFLFQQSLRQAFIALGPDGKVDWDYGAVRSKSPAFFVEALNGDPKLAAMAREAQERGELHLDPATLTDEELQAICAAKDNLSGSEKCTRRSDKLSAAAKGALISDEQRMAVYLRKTLPEVAPANGTVASVYVFGHTHSAKPPTKLALGEMKYGSADVLYVNTGAFQRVASPSQITSILAGPAKNRAKSPLDLKPEDLPACYNYVWVEPYKGKPVPRLMRWAKGVDGVFRSSSGACLNM